MSPVTITAHRKIVAVGVDGSPESTAAARYAAEFAARDAWDLWIVSAYQVPPVPASGYTTSMSASRSVAATALQETLDQVRIAPHVRLRTLLQPGEVASVLTGLCAEVQLLVLGQHHLALLDQAHEGNHASAAVSRATCPVTVVPASWDAHHTALRPVVVALDGVADAHAALALAFDDAAARRASVVVIHVTNPPLDEVQDSEVIANLAEIVAGAKQDFPDVPVRITLLDGPVSQAIVEQSATASVVVLGRPHHHHLGSWHWSVARGVLDAVACPVTVVAVDHDPSGVSATRAPSDLSGQAARG